MTEDTKLAYSANHVYREGYEQGKADLIEEGYMSPSEVNKAVARARYETLKDFGKFIDNNVHCMDGEICLDDDITILIDQYRMKR